MGLKRTLVLLLSLGILLAVASQSGHASVTSTTMALSNPYCYQPSPAVGDCYISFSYFNSATTDPGFLHDEISINGKVRAYFSTFFESSTNASTRMLGPGLKVTCGKPNSSGVAGMGIRYNVVFSAYLNTALMGTDSANVICPAYESKDFLPLIRK